jgi:hypothetical protein
MAKVSRDNGTPRNGALLLLVFHLLVGAWAVETIGSERVRRLDLSRWGTDIDIPESLAIDKYIARHYLPYIAVTMVLEGLAFGVLCWAGRRGPLRLFGVVVALALLASGVWHGFNYLVTCLFADSSRF